MNSTRKTLLSLCAALLLTLGVVACKSTSDQSSVNNGTQAGSTVSQNTTGEVNTAGLNNSTGAYVGGSGVPAQADQPTSMADANSRVGGRENVQAATADNSYAGTGQTLITSNGAKTTTTTTYSTPTVVATAPVAPNTTETIVTTTPVVTTEVTTPTVTETETTTTTTETTPMVSSVQESTTTTTTPTETTTTHRRMHKD
jgi:hypothetical protein